nr:hypothetical protein [Tanacetum cinerariifolium]
MSVVLRKLYNATGTATDGGMTQAVITAALATKADSFTPAQIARLAPITLYDQDNQFFGFETLEEAIAHSVSAGYLMLNQSVVVDGGALDCNVLNGNGYELASENPRNMIAVYASQVVNTSLRNVLLRSRFVSGCSTSGITIPRLQHPNDPDYEVYIVNSYVGNFNIIVGNLVLGPGTLLEADFFDAFTKTGATTYTSPQGGNRRPHRRRPGSTTCYAAQLPVRLPARCGAPTASRLNDRTAGNDGCLRPIPISAARPFATGGAPEGGEPRATGTAAAAAAADH